PLIPVPVVAALVPDEPAVAAHRSIAWDPGQAIALAGAPAQAGLPERLPAPVLERGSRSGAALLALVAALFPVTALRAVGPLRIAGAPALRLKPLVAAARVAAGATAGAHVPVVARAAEIAPVARGLRALGRAAVLRRAVARAGTVLHVPVA